MLSEGSALSPSGSGGQFGSTQFHNLWSILELTGTAPLPAPASAGVTIFEMRSFLCFEFADLGLSQQFGFPVVALLGEYTQYLHPFVSRQAWHKLANALV